MIGSQKDRERNKKEEWDKKKKSAEIRQTFFMFKTEFRSSYK